MSEARNAKVDAKAKNEELAVVPSSSSSVQNDVISSTSSWPDAISTIVDQRHLRCIQHNPVSAKELHDLFGFFSDGQVVPYSVEEALFEAFYDDDYDGKLHLTTLNDESSMTPLGLVFWREVPQEEMKEWINFEKLIEFAQSTRRRFQSIVNDGGMNQMQGRLMLKDESEAFFTDTTKEAIETTTLSKKSEEALVAVRNKSLTSLSAASTDDSGNIFQKWVKIELLAVRQPYWKQRIGTLLLACVMKEAHQSNNQRMILHIAGGTQNVPAVRLYERFGFVRAAPGLFRKPNKDIYVLGNIGLALQSLLWSETLQVPPDRPRRIQTIAD